MGSVGLWVGLGWRSWTHGQLRAPIRRWHSSTGAYRWRSHPTNASASRYRSVAHGLTPLPCGISCAPS